MAGISDEYHGLPKGEPLLESALKGPMVGKASDADRSRILQWVHDGAKIEGYSQVEPIFATNCVSCHMELCHWNLRGTSDRLDRRPISILHCGPQQRPPSYRRLL